MVPTQLTAAAAELSVAQLGLLAGYVALLWLPGAALGAVLGLRGWALLALSPLLTYGLATVLGPAMSELGVEWTPATAGLALLAVLAIAAVLRWPLRRWTTASPGERLSEPLPAWTAGGHGVVALATAAAGLLGGAVLLAGFGGLAAIPQDWDALLHANGTRYIAETGDSGVYGMYTVNTFAGGGEAYYPNAYHLLAALVFDLTGAAIPAVLNAQTMLIPLMLALGLVATVRAFHGRVALAVFAALVSSMATAMPYDWIWRGPLLPFATGVVLIFALLVALRHYLDRPSVLSAFPVVLAGAGLLGLHTSTIFTAALFALPMLVQRWWHSPRWLRSESGSLAAAAVLGGLLVAPHLVGALSVADSVLAFAWPKTLLPAHALGEVVGFSTFQPYPQLWLLVPLIIGVFGFRRLARLQWLTVAGAAFVVLFVLSAAYPTVWAQQLTSLWWNDKWRLAGIAAMALLPFVANGLVRVYDVLLDRLVLPVSSRVSGRAGSRPSWAAPVALVAVVGAFFVLTNAGYAERNIERTAQGYGFGATVSRAELEAFDVLDGLVEPGERVMNDRFDGSGWMYALEGVRPVAGHFGAGAVCEEVRLLAESFDRYDWRQDVQAAAAQLNVRWVMVGPGFIRAEKVRQRGLADLDSVRALDLVYDEDDVQIYELARPARSQGVSPVDTELVDRTGEVADG